LRVGPVGSVVGIADGFVELQEGSVLGPPVGLRVDSVVGIADGLQEGAAFDVSVGFRVGTEEGSSDGIQEGTAVGALMG